MKTALKLIATYTIIMSWLIVYAAICMYTDNDPNTGAWRIAKLVAFVHIVVFMACSLLVSGGFIFWLWGGFEEDHTDPM